MKFFLYLVILIAIVIISLSIKDNGLIIIEWFDYKISLSASFFFSIIFSLMVILWGTNKLIFGFFGFIKDRKSRISLKKRDQFIRSFSSTLMLLDEYGEEEAKKEIKKLKDLKNKFPIILWLETKIIKDETRLAEKLQEMLEYDVLKLYALHKLSSIALSKADYINANKYLEQALLMNPKLVWAIWGKITIYEKGYRDIEKAVITIEKAVDEKILSKAEAKNKLAELVCELAKEKAVNAPEYKVLIDKAIAYDKYNNTANKLLAKFFFDQGEITKAKNILEKIFPYKIDADTASFYLQLIINLPAEKRDKEIEHLLKQQKEPYEVYMGLARGFNNIGLLEEAKYFYTKAAEIKETKELCKNIADIEYKLSGSKDIIRFWYEKALKL